MNLILNLTLNVTLNMILKMNRNQGAVLCLLVVLSGCNAKSPSEAGGQEVMTDSSRVFVQKLEEMGKVNLDVKDLFEKFDMIDRNRADSSGTRYGFWAIPDGDMVHQVFYDKTGTLQGPYMLRSTVDANVYVLGEFRDGDFSGTWSRFAKDGRIIESVSNIEPNDSFVVLGRRPAYTGMMTEFDVDGDTLSCQRYFFNSYPFTKLPVFSTIPPSDTTKISSCDK
jgi:hypothetical protein